MKQQRRVVGGWEARERPRRLGLPRESRIQAERRRGGGEPVEQTSWVLRWEQQRVGSPGLARPPTPPVLYLLMLG